MRHPSKSASLRKLNEMGAPVATVLDVGVLTCTSELIAAYPKCKHILIEPVVEWNETITGIYTNHGIDFQLLNLAASDADGESLLEISTVIPGEPISHARLTDTKGKGPQFRKTPTRTLDSLVAEMKPAGPWLLKINVDGAELKILSGAKSMLAGCSIVIVEAGLTDLVARASLLEHAGFELFDVVDPCYYDKRLAQVDLVFLNKRTIQQHGLQIYRHGFDFAKWWNYVEPTPGQAS